MRRIRLFLIGTLIAALLPALAAPASAATTWHVASYLSRLGTDDVRASCSTSSSCWAIEGGLLLSTGDGGATWTDQTALVPADAAELTDLSCPTDTQCYLTASLDDGTPVVYAINGGTLTTTAATGAATKLVAIDCAGPLRCLTSDGTTAYRTSDGGARWTATALGVTLGPAMDLSCTPRTGHCGVAGYDGTSLQFGTTADSGQDWSFTSESDALSQFDSASISCPTATTCRAIAVLGTDFAQLWQTTDGGATWKDSRADLFNATSIACGSATNCLATGAGAYRTTDGTSWSTIATPIGAPSVVTARPTRTASRSPWAQRRRPQPTAAPGTSCPCRQPSARWTCSIARPRLGAWA